MKTNQTFRKIALFASGIAVFAMTAANAADTESNVSDESQIVNADAATANPGQLCPNGNPKGTRSANCTVGQKGRKGNFAKGRGNMGRQGNIAKGCGNQGRGQVAQGRGNGRQGNWQGRRGMGPGNGARTRAGSCVETATPTAES